MNAYSHKQFVGFEDTEQIQEAEDFFGESRRKGLLLRCKIWKLRISVIRLQKIILCKWNRKYPGDFFFTIDVNDGSWKLKGVEEFSGSSHEK